LFVVSHVSRGGGGLVPVCDNDGISAFDQLNLLCEVLYDYKRVTSIQIVCWLPEAGNDEQRFCIENVQNPRS
jgi:hypothetical protein